MNKDELILDILEKTYAKVEKNTIAIQEIKIEQAKQGLIHENNQAELTEHIRGVRAAEGRLDVLEKDAQFFRNFITTCTILGGIILFLMKVLPLIH